MAMRQFKGRVASSLLAVGFSAISYGAATAQTRPSAAPGAVVTPVEISAGIVNGAVRCRPPRARLPADDRLELRIVNDSGRPVAFAAPKFFNASNILESGGFTWNIVNDTLVVAPRSTVWVRLQSPAPGEYYYSCFEPGEIPTDQSSGFLIVMPKAD
jgi:hypothetical protein